MEAELGAASLDRAELHVAAETSSDVLRDHQAQPYTVLVQLLLVFDEAKQLEQFTLVLVFYAYSGILHAYEHALLPVTLLNQLGIYVDSATQRELYCV